MLATPNLSASIPTTTKKEFITRRLGNTGIELPIVSMGVMRADNPNLVKGALRMGVVHLDTAHGYQNGNNELMLGEILKDYPRDSFVIATKVKADGRDKEGNFTDQTSIDDFLRKFHLSLERLKLDYVDILYSHDIYSRDAVFYKPLNDALLKLKADGKVKHLGVSTHRNENIVIDAVVESGIYEVVLTAINFKQGHVQQIKESIANAAEKGVGIIAMKTMMGGFLDSERKQPVNASAALKWVMHDANICTSIPGFTTFEEMVESVAVNEDLSFSDQEKDFLAMAATQTGLYCQGCSKCVASCPYNLPIPDLMRAYMYAYGYRETAKAGELLSGPQSNTRLSARKVTRTPLNIQAAKQTVNARVLRNRILWDFAVATFSTYPPPNQFKKNKKLKSHS
jgi:predicted aldo/keto reductase-like oxidoreductase